MLCAIHQPNFMPWLGFFDKIARADVFVFLNHVDYEKSGHSMQSITNRVAIIGGEKIHCPVIREHGSQIIDTVVINESLPWREEILTKLEKQYASAPFLDETRAFVNELLNYPTNMLSDLNINATMKICEALDIETQFVCQSNIEYAGHSSELLISIIKEVGCSEYLHGKGGTKYQEDDLFEAAGIKLVPQKFEPWEYQQGKNTEFIKGLSIIDAFCWLGIKETGNRIREYSAQKG